MSTCPNCGIQNPEGTDYCPYCGAAQSTLPPWMQPEPVAPQPQPIVTQPVWQQPQPVAAQPEPVFTQPEPVVVQPEPVVVPTEPIVAQPEPVIVQSESVAVQPEPVVVQPQPYIAPSAPAAPQQPYAPYAPPAAQPAYTQTVNAGNSNATRPMSSKIMGIISMTLGILACSLFCYLGLLGIPALILGIISMKQSKAVGLGNNMAKAGIITGAIALGLYALIFLGGISDSFFFSDFDMPYYYF